MLSNSWAYVLLILYPCDLYLERQHKLTLLAYLLNIAVLRRD